MLAVFVLYPEPFIIVSVGSVQDVSTINKVIDYPLWQW